MIGKGMMDKESKNDNNLKRFQLSIAILASVVTLSLGLYNAKKIFFSENGPGKLSLEVRALNESVISGAAVEIKQAQGSILTSSKTDGAGFFELSDINPGSYTLKASKGGFESETILFTIEPGRTAELEVKLKPASSSIRTTVEELGASWLKTLASPKANSEKPAPPEPAATQ
jgi:hypothetical protein